MMPPLSTIRLSLRPVELRDVNGISSIVNDPLFVQASVGCQMPASDMQLLRWIISQQKQHQSGKGCCYTVRDAMGKNLIGLIMLQPKEQRMELSYWLSPSYWRQGLMSEALFCVLHEWHRYNPKTIVYSCCNVNNKASIALLEKIGMQNYIQLIG
ncbi:MAG: N-acetyltransferase [Gammaproteobacteria bacterium]|nr:N-acetyltransferase [Gammaproteobacteria bacterium]